jgi:hypothetical protein
MNIQYHEVNKFPVVVIDDFYDEIAKEKIMQELLFLHNDPRKMLDPNDTGAAMDINTEEPLKKNKGVFLSNVFVNKEHSNILTESSINIFDGRMNDRLKPLHTFFRYFENIKNYSTLISYYEQNDYYKSHMDNAIITAITWFYKQPKAFTGGNLTVEEQLKIECKNNRFVIFPSILFHSVDALSMNPNITDDHFGRFAITHFLYTLGN